MRRAARVFREAAEGLFVTRAALGKAISTLEAELGQPLFDRSRDGVCPTAFAASYLNQARASLTISTVWPPP